MSLMQLMRLLGAYSGLAAAEVMRLSCDAIRRATVGDSSWWLRSGEKRPESETFQAIYI